MSATFTAFAAVGNLRKVQLSIPLNGRVLRSIRSHLSASHRRRAGVGARACGSGMTELFRRMAPGNNWILAVSDDTPANADIERFLWVSELVEKYGSLPLA